MLRKEGSVFCRQRFLYFFVQLPFRCLFSRRFVSGVALKSVTSTWSVLEAGYGRIVVGGIVHLVFEENRLDE